MVIFSKLYICICWWKPCENFDLINNSPIVEKWCGKVNEVYPGIYRLRRGEIYNINGKSIFVLGGAMSNPNQKEGNYEGKGKFKKKNYKKYGGNKKYHLKKNLNML